MTIQHPGMLALILAFFGWMLFIGYRTHLAHRKSEQRENFLIGNRNVPAWLVAIGTTMGWVDALCFGVVPGLSYQYGWGTLWYLLGAALPFLVLAIFAGQIRTQAAKTGAYMMGNYFSRMFSPRCAAAIGVAVWLYFNLWMLTQFAIGGHILSALTNLPYPLVIAAMGSVTLAYMLMGGFLASIRTDLAQFVIFTIFLVTMLVLWGSTNPATWLPAGTSIWSGYADPFTMFMLSLVSTIAAPDVWQRIYSADTPRDARRSMALLTVLIPAMYGVFLFLGLIIKSKGLPLDENGMTTAIFTNLTPSWLMPLSLVAFMAAIMSTIATTLFGSAMALASDVALELGWINRAQTTPLCRALMVLLLLLTLGLALIPFNVLSLYITVMALCSVFVPLIVCALMGYKVTEPAAFYSLVASLVCFFIGCAFNLFDGSLGTLPLFVATGTLLLFQGLTQKNKSAKRRPS